jgi:hypothetical protein
LFLGIPKPSINSSFEANVEFFSINGNSGVERCVVILDSFGLYPE